jgi:hypothetical protein
LPLHETDFILNNLLHFAFIMLFVRSHFVWAEVMLILNFANLTSLYFRRVAVTHHPRLLFVHFPAVSGPLAWTFVALYWNGAIMVPHHNSLVARIFANIFVWALLGYGMFFIAAYKVRNAMTSRLYENNFISVRVLTDSGWGGQDYSMGFSLSVLSAALGVAQFFRQIVAFQWIFAFTIMAVLFVFTVIVAVPAWTTRSETQRPADAERAPLLADN